MNLTRSALVTIAILMLFAAAALAQEDSSAGMADSAAGMPQMGPPEEIKLLEPMVGNWNFNGEMISHPGADPEPLEATAVISYVCGGAALQFEYAGEVMGMTMHGLSLTTYNSQAEKWEEVWTDNLSGRFSNYSGTFEEGRLVVAGTEMHMGSTMHTRVTRWDMTETAFEWKMEYSTDGESWFVTMSGTYSRQ